MQAMCKLDWGLIRVVLLKAFKKGKKGAQQSQEETDRMLFEMGKRSVECGATGACLYDSIAYLLLMTSDAVKQLVLAFMIALDFSVLLIVCLYIATRGLYRSSQVCSASWYNQKDQAELSWDTALRWLRTRGAPMQQVEPTTER